jgi:phospholipid/cholesterol/gamma-HCH transport system permease protein
MKINSLHLWLKLLLLKSFLLEIGELAFCRSVFQRIFRPFEFKEFLRQCFYMGIALYCWSPLLDSSLVWCLPCNHVPLLEFGAVSWMPSMVSISIIREIGPIITALICAGRIGSGIGAELGSMRVTEQIDAMEVSGTNPFKYLVVTRIMATTLMLPILVFWRCYCSFGSYLVENIKGTYLFYCISIRCLML